MPSPALLTDVQRLQQQFGQAGPREQKLLPRIEAVLASWQGVGGKEIKERFGVNHDTLWRTKVLLRDGGVQGFLAANKRLRVCKPKGL